MPLCTSIRENIKTTEVRINYASGNEFYSPSLLKKLAHKIIPLVYLPGSP